MDQGFPTTNGQSLVFGLPVKMFLKRIADFEIKYSFQKIEQPNQWLFLVPLKGGRWHIIPQLAVYTTYSPWPSGGLYATYHLLGEPETTIEPKQIPTKNHPKTNGLDWLDRCVFMFQKRRSQSTNGSSADGFNEFFWAAFRWVR